MNVGILGCGTIGGGVLNLIDNLPSSSGIKVLKVFDLPSKKDMLGERFAQTIDEVCLNPEIDVVIEAMGGDKFPYECIVKALKSKKSVVTSNKETVSLHIEEFYALAKENGVRFMCEASVGGGIPHGAHGRTDGADAAARIGTQAAAFHPEHGTQPPLPVPFGMQTGRKNGTCGGSAAADDQRRRHTHGRCGQCLFQK